MIGNNFKKGSSDEDVNVDKVKGKTEKYLMAFLIFILPLVVSISLPLFPLGGNFVIPIILSLILVVLYFNSYEYLVKYIIVIYVMLSVIIQGLVVYSNLYYINQQEIRMFYITILEISIIIASFILITYIVIKTDLITITFGSIVGVFILIPGMLPIGLGLLIIFVLYMKAIHNKKFFNLVMVFVIAMFIVQPFIVAMNVSNTNINSNTTAYFLVTPNIYYLHGATQGNISNVSATVSNSGFYLKSPLEKPIYLLGSSNDILSEYKTISMLSYPSKSSNSTGNQIYNSISTISFYSLDLLVAIIIFLFSLLISDEVFSHGLTSLYKDKKEENFTGLDEIIIKHEWLIQSALLGVVFIVFLSAVQIPLDFKTQVGFNLPFIIGTIFISLIGGYSIDWYDSYLKNLIKKEKLVKEIKYKISELENNSEDLITEINNVKKYINDVSITDNKIRQISKSLEDIKNIKENVDSAAYISLKQYKEVIDKTLGDFDKLKNKYRSELYNVIRNDLNMYNNMIKTKYLDKYINIKYDVIEYTGIDDLNKLLSIHDMANNNAHKISKNIKERYSTLVNALSKMFPDKISSDIPEFGDMAPGNIIEFFNVVYKEKCEMVKEEYKKAISELKSMGYKISSLDEDVCYSDIFYENFRVYLKDTVKELEEYKNSVKLIRESFERVIQDNEITNNISSTSHVQSIIDSKINQLSEWKNLHYAVSSLLEYKLQYEKIIKDNVMKDKLSILNLDLYFVIEDYVKDMLENKKYISLNDIPLSEEFAKIFVKFFKDRNVMYKINEINNTIEKIILREEAESNNIETNSINTNHEKPKKPRGKKS
ncbi:MAG: hypothetical protein ACP5RS_06595 [Thermoplasmata archaeon]